MAPFIITRDLGCRRDLLWRLYLPDGEGFGGLVARLVASGWSEIDVGSELLRSFEREDGHVIVVSPRSRKVQVRISPEAPKEERASSAASIAALLERSWTRTPSDQPGGNGSSA
ncbi:MAG: hypothetical protein HYV07_27985 [Deltaproteobacteria bacterium]|nr:hypothetical protein [Deltaproteobacteria bacterium]